MHDHYQVKWTTRDGVAHYGYVYPTYDWTPTNERPPAGKLFVNDAVLPVLHIVAEQDIVDIPLDHTSESEIEKHVEAEFKKAETASALLGNTFAPGKLFSLGVADGSAYYVVTKVNKKTVKVEWRGFGGADRYTDQLLGWGGTFPRPSIEQQVRRYDGLRSLFSRKNLQPQA